MCACVRASMRACVHVCTYIYIYIYVCLTDSGHQPVQVVDLRDLREEHVLVSARLKLLQRNADAGEIVFRVVQLFSSCTVSVCCCSFSLGTVQHCRVRLGNIARLMAVSALI